MAKQYGLNEAVDFAAANLVSFGGSFTRLNGQPIDKSQLWYPIWEEVEQEGGAKVKVYKTGLARAQAYAATNAAYVGQELAVIDVKYNAYAEDGVTPTENATVTGTAVTFYGIQDAAGALKELGAKPLGDDVAISVGADNKITLVDFASAAEGTVARKSGGKLTWVPISSIVKGDGNNVVSDVSDTISVTSTTIDDASVRYNLEVKVSETEDNQLTVVGDGLYVAPATHPEYTVAKEATPTTGSQATYVLKKDGVATGDKIEIPVAPEQTDYTVTVSTDMEDDHALKHYIFSQCGKEIAHIDVPKDLVVESGKVEVKEEAGAWGEAGTYIVLEIANQEEPIYVNAKDLVDVYTVSDTSTVDMTITGTEIKADVKVSAEAGNSLTAKTDGLYVNVPTLPTVSDEKVENQVVVAVKQTNGAIEVEREQLSYKTLKDKPEWEVVDVQPQDPPSGEGEPATESFQALADIVVTHGENGFEATYKTYEAVGKGHFDATIVGLDGRIDALETAVFGDEGNTTDGLISDLAALTSSFSNFKSDAQADNGLRFINQSEIDKLAKLSIEGDDLTISGSVNADQVKGLYDFILSAVLGSPTDLDPDTEDAQNGLGIEAGAQVNLIESISLPERVLAIDENKNVAIPYATTTLAGVVKSSTAVNTVRFEEGIGTVNSVSTDILEQGTKTLVFNCGSIDE